MRRKIVAVFGLGLFGQSLCRELGHYGCEVIAIDSDEHKVHLVSEDVTTAAVGDFTDLELIKGLGVGNADIAVIATGSNLESAILAVMHLKRMGIREIVAKASNESFEEVLFQLGVTMVVSPERESGHRLASEILSYHIGEVLRLDENNSVIEFTIPKKWVGKNLKDLNPRQKYDINILGMRVDRGGTMKSIDPDMPLPSEGYVVALAFSHTFERYDYLGQLK